MNPKLITLVEIISSGSLDRDDPCSVTCNKDQDEYHFYCETIDKCETCAFSDDVIKYRFNNTIEAFNEYKNSINN